MFNIPLCYTVTVTELLPLLCRAMLRIEWPMPSCGACLVRCLSVCLSVCTTVTFVCCIEKSKHILKLYTVSTKKQSQRIFSTIAIVHAALLEPTFCVFYHFIIHVYCSFCPRCVLSSFNKRILHYIALHW